MSDSIWTTSGISSFQTFSNLLKVSSTNDVISFEKKIKRIFYVE